MLKNEEKKEWAKKCANFFLKLVSILFIIFILAFLGMGIYVLLMDFHHNGLPF